MSQVAAVEALVAGLSAKLTMARKDTPGELHGARMMIPDCPHLGAIPENLVAEIARHNAQCREFAQNIEAAENAPSQLAAAIATDLPGEEHQAQARSLLILKFDLSKLRILLLASKSTLCEGLAKVAAEKLEVDAAALDAERAKVAASLDAAGLGLANCAPMAQHARKQCEIVVAHRIAKAAPVRAAQLTHEQTKNDLDRLKAAAYSARNRDTAGAYELAVAAWSRLVGNILP